MRRIVLYSHDTMGLGHLRRNLLIAQALASSPAPAAILLITGASQASAFATPPGVDCLSLPSLRKNDDGGYHSRRLGISTSALIALRSKMIRTAIEQFDPHVLIVDKVPRGVLRELDPTLEFLRATDRTRCVLGLRDVLDDPSAVRSEWRDEENDDAVDDFYDAVWVYGDPHVYDLVREYGFSDAVVGKLHYTGYLDPRLRLEPDCSGGTKDVSSLGLPPGNLAVCLVGGGEDGARLATAFAQSELPPYMNGVILAGPFMPPHLCESLSHTAADNPRRHVLRFMDEPDRLVRCADRVIAMGGYNTICEVLCHRKRALVVPRVTPRREQWIRARRMEEFDLLDVLHPDQLTPGRLTDWLARDGQPVPPDPSRIDFNGLVRLPRLLDALCEGSTSTCAARKTKRGPLSRPHPHKAAAVWSSNEDPVPLC